MFQTLNCQKPQSIKRQFISGLQPERHAIWPYLSYGKVVTWHSSSAGVGCEQPSQNSQLATHQDRVPWNDLLQVVTIAGRGLLSRWAIREPDTTLTRGRHVTLRDTVMIFTMWMVLRR